MPRSPDQQPNPCGYAANFRGLSPTERQAVLEHAEPGRGDQYHPRPTQEDPYRNTWHDHPVAQLPPTDPFREGCLAGSRRTGTARRALHRLRILCDPISLTADSYVNGQHRAQAMKDQLVGDTVITRLAHRDEITEVPGMYRL